MKSIGIDGCRAGWLAAIWDSASQQLEFSLSGELALLIQSLPEEAPIFIDMPLGLPTADAPIRACDVEAQRLLGHKLRARVFHPPIRETFGTTNYTTACNISRELTGKAFSIQAWNITPKIIQLDTLLREQPELSKRLHESHPEICFMHLSTPPEPIFANKKTDYGADSRLARIAAHAPEMGRQLQKNTGRFRSTEALLDDMLDATVLALCANNPRQWSAFPEGPPTDDYGLPMRMSYWAAAGETLVTS